MLPPVQTADDGDFADIALETLESVDAPAKVRRQRTVSVTFMPTTPKSARPLSKRICRYPRLYATSIFFGLSGGFHFGYQISATNSASPILQPYFNDSLREHYGVEISSRGLTWLWAFHVSILYLGGIFGAIFAAKVADHYGRRRTVLFFSYWTFVALCLNMFGFARSFKTFEVLMLARFLVGVATAVNQVVTGTYLTEVSAMSQRGRTGIIGSSLQLRFFFIIGIVLGLPQMLGQPTLWPYIYVVEICLCVVQIFGLHFSPDSPTFLVAHDRIEKAESVIAKMRRKHVDTKKEVEMIRSELSLQTNKLGVVQMFTTTKANKRAALLALAIAGAGPLSGSYALISYSTLLFEKMHFTSTTSVAFSVGVGCLALTGILMCSFFYIGRYGRRRILLCSHCAVLICDYLLLILQLINDYTGSQAAGVAFAIVVAIHTMCLTSGMGPFMFFLATELVPNNARVACQSIGIGFIYVTSFVNPLIYLPLNEAVSGYAIFMFIIPLTICTSYCYYRLPETRGRSIHEIVAELDDDNAGHSFVQPLRDGVDWVLSRRRGQVAPSKGVVDTPLKSAAQNGDKKAADTNDKF